jgi:hypothetical protein
MVLSYDYAKRKRRRQRTNAPPSQAILMTMWSVEVVHATSTNAAWPGLLRKPLDAVIGRLLTPYRPGGRQGDSKQYKDVICTHFDFDGRFNGHRDAVLSCALPDGGGPGLL